ncbi:MAG: lysozyme [Nitrosomonas sp.]|nr:lysozyme [Nitrosomonas sp.]
MRKMQVGQAGKQLFKEWEGLRTHVYLDSGGEPTIGIGHLLTRDERASGKIWINGQPVRYANGLTEQQCWDLLEQDLDIAEAAVNDRIIVPITQNQFDALVSFAFNVGAEAFRKSTLVRALNQGQYDQVPTQLRRWVRDNGVVVPGLVNRREKEIELWNK